MNRVTIVSMLLLVGVTACNPERVKYTNELKQEMADSKIKRITNADLVGTIDNLGEKISTIAQNELTTQISRTTNSTERTRLCQLQGMPRTKAIAERYDLIIRLLGPADIHNNELNQKEREILDAYLYNAKQKLAPISNIQKTNDTTFVYNVAIPVDNPICEICFGKQEIPFAVWHLEFKKREVIRRMNASKKKSK